METKKKVLFLDDDEGVCLLFKKILEPYPVEVYTTGTLQSSLSLCLNEAFDLIILDYNVSDGIGWELAREIYKNPKKYGSPEILLMSGTVTLTDIAEEDSFYADCNFLSKPFSVIELREKIINILKI